MIFQYIDILRYSLSQYGIDTVCLVIDMQLVYLVSNFLVLLVISFQRNDLA